MYRFLAALLAAAGLLTPAAIKANEQEDERWISRFVAENKRPAANTAVAGVSRQIEFSQLAGMQGQEVRVIMSDGRMRRGQVERADARTLTLRVNLPSGYARLRLAPSQIRQISRE